MQHKHEAERREHQRKNCMTLFSSFTEKKEKSFDHAVDPGSQCVTNSEPEVK